MLDSPHDIVEWMADAQPFSRDRDGDRCLLAKMGSLLSGVLTGGHWSDRERFFHIIVLELLDAWFSLKKV